LWFLSVSSASAQRLNVLISLCTVLSRGFKRPPSLGKKWSECLIDCRSPSPRSAKRKRLVESSEEDVPDDTESQDGDDESEDREPVQ
jgi:hypothetical protein